MTERQFQQSLNNRRRRRPVDTVTDTVAGDVLRSAAGKARRWDAAASAWQRVARPEWQGLAWPAALENGVLVIVAPQATCRFELSKRRESLERELSRLGGGVQRLRIEASSDWERVDGP